MKTFLICLVLLGIVAPVALAGYDNGDASDGFLTAGEYEFSVDLFNTDSLIVDGGGADKLYTNDENYIEVRSTSEPLDWGSGGLWEVGVYGDSHYVQYGGLVRSVDLGNNATAVFKGGTIITVDSLQTVETKHITFECLPGWSWKYTGGQISGITGQWANGDFFSTDLYPAFLGVYPNVWENIQVVEVPEPATLALLGLGGLLIRRKNNTPKAFAFTGESLFYSHIFFIFSRNTTSHFKERIMGTQRGKPGFTLIELMVVIGVIAIMVSIALPVFSLSKKKGREVACLANISTLGKAWTIYAEMNDDGIVIANPRPVSAGPPHYSWVEAPNDPDNCTTAEEIVGIENGALFSYLETVDVYHCTGDLRHLRPPMDTTCTGDGGYRSYSIPAGLNGVTHNPNLKKFSISNNYTEITRKTDIKSPSSKYVFVEEAYGKGMNQDAWNFIPHLPEHLDEYADPVALWHGNGSTFCFADGHAKSRTWQDAQLIQTTSEQKNAPLADYVSNGDAGWLAMGFPYLQYIGP